MSPRPPWVKHHYSAKEANAASQGAATSSDISVITAGQGRLSDDVFRQQRLQQKNGKTSEENICELYGYRGGKGLQ